jgi:mRNA interferase RelE/StbE
VSGGYTVDGFLLRNGIWPSLTSKVQARVLRKVDDLASDPRPHGVVKLSGSEDLYRVRVGRHRVIYAVVDDMVLVTVVKIARREEKTYRGL